MKRALVLSGGGSKGGFQVGVLKALLEAGCSWDSIHGISVGALNGAYLSMFKPEEQPFCFEGLNEIWKGVTETKKIYKPWAPWKFHYLYSMFKGSLNSGSPLKKIVSQHLNKQKLDSSGVKFTVGCCSLTSGQYVTVPGDSENIMDYILASSHFPLVFEPLTIDGEQWVDGGIRHQIPILEALKENPDEIDVIITSPVSVERIDSLENILVSAPKVAMRASEILADQVYISDFFTVLKVAKAGRVKVRLFAPNKMPIRSSMDFDGENIQTLISEGYEYGLKELKGES